MAVHASRGVPRAIPVLHDGHVVGLIRGDRRGKVSEYTPITYRQWCGFNTYADLDTAAKTGNRVQAIFFKDLTTGPASGWSDTWPCQGQPGAGDYSGAANTLRKFDNTTAGCIRFSSLTISGGPTRHLANWQATCSGTNIVSSIMLYDRVASYDNGGISTTPTTFTNTLSPARYVSSGQEGLLVVPTAQTTTGTGATASNISSLTFTDQGGNTAVSATFGGTVTWAPSAAAGTTTFPSPVMLTDPFLQPWLPLAANVSGVRKLETVTSSAVNTGPVCWVLFHPVGTIWVQSGLNMRQELARATFALERIYDDACLSMLVQSVSNAARSIFGYTELVHG